MVWIEQEDDDTAGKANDSEKAGGGLAMSKEKRGMSFMSTKGEPLVSSQTRLAGESGSAEKSTLRKGSSRK